MAVVRYECETIGCGTAVPNAAVKHCTRCKARKDNERTCPLCENQFDATGFHDPDTAVCCGPSTMVDFYRGRTLNDRQLAWVYETSRTATIDQREIAMWLAAHLRSGEESVSATWESPHHTSWVTSPSPLDIVDEERREVEVEVEFAGPYSRTTNPVVQVTIGDEYTGLDYNVVTDVIERLTRRG